MKSCHVCGTDWENRSYELWVQIDCDTREKAATGKTLTEVGQRFAIWRDERKKHPRKNELHLKIVTDTPSDDDFELDEIMSAADHMRL